ncbi:MAG TPA: GAF domain-containing protein [Burkholderiaceae bacterium]
MLAAESDISDISDIVLQESIDAVTELNGLLELFGAEIEKTGLVDGYMVNLRDARAEYLVSQKVHLTPEFHNLENTYHHYKVALSGDALNLNARAYHNRGIVQCNRATGSEAERNVLRLWKLEEIGAIAILDDGDFGKAPLGTLLLLKEHGEIEDHVFVAMEHLISLFHAPLQRALQQSFLQEHEESNTLEQSRFLQFVVELNNLTSNETIFQMFATEMFRQFAFDGLGFFLLQGDALVCKRVETADPHYHDVCHAWSAFMRNNPYALDATDGGVSHAYLKHQALFFPDVQTIMDLPMSAKDRQSLTILETPRTLLLMPIGERRHAIGVLAFFSLQQPVAIPEEEQETIRHLAAHFGKALSKIDDYLLG